MRQVPQGGIVSWVSQEHAWLSIVFDLQADPIAGVVCDHVGHGLPFAGWMELTRTIEHALDAARRAEAGGPADCG